MGVSEDVIYVCCADSAVYLRVSGRGTFKNSVPLRVYVQRMLARGVRRFVVDIGECSGMDSTFMGTLTGIFTRLREAGGGSLDVINVSEKNRELLTELGLDQLFTIHSDAADFEKMAQAEPLVSPEKITSADVHKTVLDAHRSLAEEGHEDNEMRFRDLLDELRDSSDQNQ